MRDPGCVALREVECLRVRRLVFLPACYRVGESQLERLHSLRPTEQRLQLRAQSSAIERHCRIGLVGVHRLSLHELPPHGEHRRPFVMPRFERTYVGLDVEQLREKVLHVRRHVDQQRRFVFARQRIRRRTRGSKTLGERRVGSAQMFAEPLIDRLCPFDRIKIGEAKAECQLQHDLP